VGRFGDHVEIGHAAPEQRVSRAEVVVMSSPDIIAAYRLRGSSIFNNSDRVSRKAAVRSSRPLSASRSSPANISPVGPPPAITTAWRRCLNREGY
jgi:hypothetical protein